MVTELAGLVVVAHTLAHVAGITIAGRRIILEAGLRRFDPARHRLYCRREGNGPPVLLIHGLGGSWRYWRRGMDGLCDHHAVYLLDLIGFGRSPKPRGDYSLEMHLRALAPVLERIDGPMTVVGHSMGAVVALGAYAAFPERVGRLVLIGLPYFPSVEAAEKAVAGGGVMNRLVIARSWLAPAVCYMKDIIGLPIFAPLAGMPGDLYRDYFMHTWASFSRSLFNTLLGSDLDRLFGRVDRSRITLIHGKQDVIAPVEYMRGLVQRFPDLTLKELRGTHHLYLAFPRLMNHLITGRGPDEGERPVKARRRVHDAR